MSRHRSKPDAPGSITSSSTQSGAARIATTASCASTASSTRKPSASRKSRINAAISGSSSTTSTSGPAESETARTSTVSPTNAAGSPIFATLSQPVRTRANSLPNHECTMSEHLSPPRNDRQISRRSLLGAGVAATALAALPSCDSAGSPPGAGPPQRRRISVRRRIDRPARDHQPRSVRTSASVTTTTGFTSSRLSRLTPATRTSSSPPARRRPRRTPSSSRRTSRSMAARAGRTAACHSLPRASPTLATT